MQAAQSELWGPMHAAASELQAPMHAAKNELWRSMHTAENELWGPMHAVENTACCREWAGGTHACCPEWTVKTHACLLRAKSELWGCYGWHNSSESIEYTTAHVSYLTLLMSGFHSTSSFHPIDQCPIFRIKQRSFSTCLSWPLQHTRVVCSCPTPSWYFLLSVCQVLFSLSIHCSSHSQASDHTPTFWQGGSLTFYVWMSLCMSHTFCLFFLTAPN